MSAAAMLLFAALSCWWFALIDAAFVCATLGAVAWFLSLRNQLRVAHIESETARQKQSHDQEGSQALDEN
ncbi:MAG: hypothetical protein WKF30_13415 [Pyrinomonadaceae bacterium]